MSRPKRVLLALLIAIVVGGTLAFRSVIRRGFSTRNEPSAVEHFLARQMRRWAVPAKARGMKNPFADSAEAVAAGRAHFADHCAVELQDPVGVGCGLASRL